MSIKENKFIGNNGVVEHSEDGIIHVVESTGSDKVTPLNNNNTLKDKFKNKIDKIKLSADLAKERDELIKQWRSIMANNKKFNSRYDTFNIVNETKTPYGWSFKLYVPDGLSFNDLESARKPIEHGIGCTFMYDIHKSNKYANCKIIYDELVKCNSIPFNTVSVKPYEICPGVRITGEPIIIDVNTSPHILIAGQTRKGKNGSADSIILNWLNSCTEDDIQLYLFQCAKVDLIKYKNCRQVKCFVLADFNKMLIALKYLVDVEIGNRLKLFEDMFMQRKGENIFDYNNLHPRAKMPYIYVIMDEFLELMLQSPSKGDKEINEVKNSVLTYVQRLGQMGAGVGVQYMIMHQKPEKALCPTFIKNMSSVRICFGFDDISCGRIVLGEQNGGLVTEFPPRRAYVNNNGTLELMYTTDLSNRRDMFIRKHEISKGREDLFDMINSMNSDKAAKPNIKHIKDAKEDTTINRTTRENTGTAILPSGRLKKVEVSNKDTCDIKSIDIKKADIKKEDIKKVDIKKADIKKTIKDGDMPVINYCIHEKLGKLEVFSLLDRVDNKFELCDMYELMEVDIEEDRTDKEKVDIEEKVDIKEDRTDKEKVSSEQLQSSKKHTKVDRLIKDIHKIDTSNLQETIDSIVAENAKKNSTWVPYVAKDGTDNVDIDKIKAAKFFKL